MRAIILVALAAMLLPAAPAGATDAADACPAKTVSSGTNPEHIVTTHADCSVAVELNRGIICVGAWGRTDEYQVGNVHVTNHRCTFPGGDPLPPITTEPITLQAAGPCGQTHIDGPVSVALLADCSVLVSIRLVECVWGGYWHQHTPAPVQIREYRCGPPPGAVA